MSEQSRPVAGETLPRPEPTLADEATIADMAYQLWSAGLDRDEAAFTARMLWRNGLRIGAARPAPQTFNRDDIKELMMSRQMSDDLVKQLKHWGDWFKSKGWNANAATAYDAADEIKRLRQAEIDAAIALGQFNSGAELQSLTRLNNELRQLCGVMAAALEQIEEHGTGYYGTGIASRALAAYRASEAGK